jgi:6,7-dimethyl-8-ribityllumazine synthase
MGKGIEKVNLDANGLRIAIVVSRFNEELTGQLAGDAFQCLEKSGAAVADIEIFEVPGAYEIPVVANQLAASGNYDALIVLGVVVEGETQHAQMIIDTTGQTILDISCRHGIPVINEIVGVRTWEQAVARCSSSQESRGWYAAEAAIETANLMKRIKDSK